MNDLELCVYGLKRSGNHAIIYWLISLFPDLRTVFLNDVSQSKEDPFYGKKRCKLFGFEESKATENFHSIERDVLLYSFEDSPDDELLGRDYMDCVLNPEMDRKRREAIGPSQKRIRIMILRDPFNGFSSRLKGTKDGQLRNAQYSIQQISGFWKNMALRAISDEPSPAFDDEFVILFNRWTSDRAYRKSICNRLSGVYSEKSMDSVPKEGGGSSFSGRDLAKLEPRRLLNEWPKIFDWKRLKRSRVYLKRLFVTKSDRASALNQRWQAYQHDPEFRLLFKDPDILRLSESLFGEIAGTREFVASVIAEAPDKS